MKITLIESKLVKREFGMTGTIAVVDHPKHGRLLIVDGYGGEYKLRGGMVRWEHGMVAKLLPGDTLTTLSTPWNDWYLVLDAILLGLDESRPLQKWTGDMVSKLAKSAGL